MPEELLANLFIQSNVIFDDFMKVTRLEATVDVDVIGSGVENEVAVLTTGMQTFDGEKKGSGISGTVVVRSVHMTAAIRQPFLLRFPMPIFNSGWSQMSASNRITNRSPLDLRNW